MSWKDILKELSPRERMDAEDFAPEEMHEGRELKRMRDATIPVLMELRKMFKNRRLPEMVERTMLGKLLNIFEEGFDKANSPEEWNESYDELRLHIKTVLNNIFDSPYEDVDKWLKERGIYKL